MECMTAPDVDRAAHFIAGNARVLDRRRFERLFRGGPAEPVRDAVAAYRNADGGLGQGLEPDCRDPHTQPGAIDLGLRILDETDAWDEALVSAICDWLAANAPADGGAVFVEPSVEGWPHAPWWTPPAERRVSLNMTGSIAGTLHRRGVQHPWLEQATELAWSLIDELASGDAYEVFGVLHFLQHVPDRARAQTSLERVGRLIVDQGLVTLDPEASGEIHTPLDFAPEPTSLARRLFDQPTIDAHLDHLARGQREDGGWMFNFLSWSPAAERDWRGHITVDALRVLRANGRL
jgi:hypothetical protein